MTFRRIRVGLMAAITLLTVPSKVQSGRSKSSLFELTEQVEEISPAKFLTIAESSAPWVLDCYSPACPHCVRFKPKWEMVGKALQDSAVNVGAVNCIKHKDLCHTLSVSAYPTLILLNPPGQPRGTSTEPAIKKLAKSGSYESIVDTIKLEFPDEVDPAAVADVAAARVLEQAEVTSRKTHGTENETGSVGVGAPCILRIEDAVTSVRFFLKNELFTQGPKLSKDRLGALVSFLDLLSTSFPGKVNRASFRNLATELRRDPGMNDIARWDKRIATFQVGHFPPSEEDNWPAANFETESDPNPNNYSSGLWSLFHALSVSSAPMKQSPHAIMEGIHSFVFNFFRCQHCRDHFLEMYDNCDNGRCVIPATSNMRGRQTSTAEPALALWVWRMHNAVNAAIALEADEEPHKRLWPSEKTCSECWSGFPSGNDKDYNQPPWSEGEVLKVLHQTFSCPAAVGEGDDDHSRNWAVTCVLVCAGVALLVWVRRWIEMRGIGLNKKRVDSVPSL
eukprot:g1702.t1